MRSKLKPSDDIALKECSQAPLYPLGLSPYLWNSCGDAYEYTWLEDFKGDLAGLRKLDKVRLARSMGFCPHQRCQLSDVSSSGTDGTCPKNLCYTKIENGSLSFGACCFSDGIFNDIQLFGVYNKTQATAKPLYRHSRVVLGGEVGADDDSYKSFVNANMVYPSLIVTQCPITQNTSSRIDTIRDVQRMILEQNIVKWIQLAPNLPDNTAASIVGAIPLGAEGSLPGNCGVFPLEIMKKVNSGEDHLGFSNFRVDDDTAHYMNITYTISGYRWFNHEKNLFEVSLDSPSHAEDASLMSVTVSHLWFHQWRDFEVPHRSTDGTMNKLIDDSIHALLQNQSVAVSCLSGRGRSGTFSAMLLAKLRKLSSYSELTNEIVKMRENRDGLVETPAHFRYITRVLGWKDPGACSAACRLHVAMLDASDQLQGSRDQLFSVLLFLVLLVSTYLLLIRDGKWPRKLKNENKL